MVHTAFAPLSSSALDWLQALLRERFAPLLRLSRESDCSYLLEINGAPGHIALGDFGARSDVQAVIDGFCARWNPHEEGWQAALPDSLPAPGPDRLPAPLIVHADQGYRLRYDVLGAMYWALSRSEEVNSPHKDVHGRFPAAASHAFRHGYLERPWVDEWLHIIRQIIRRQWPQLELEKSCFAIVPSHDVDFPSRYALRSAHSYVRTVGADLLRGRRYVDALRSPRIRWGSSARLRLEDPANTFDWIMDVSERNAVQSAFYFICGRTNSRFDGGYEVEASPIKELMRRIHERGHEIGLHPSYETFRNPVALAAEARRLRAACAAIGVRQEEWGGRMHYLRWSQPETALAWEQAGLTYDSTLGYADRAGFRCGTCFEYPAFDPISKQQLQLRLRPLIAMESSVIDKSYMGLGLGEAAFDTFIRLKRACHAVGGSFTLLWHNSELFRPEQRELYESVLSS